MRNAPFVTHLSRLVFQGPGGPVPRLIPFCEKGAVAAAAHASLPAMKVQSASDMENDTTIRNRRNCVHSMRSVSQSLPEHLSFVRH